MRTLVGGISPETVLRPPHSIGLRANLWLLDWDFDQSDGASVRRGNAWGNELPGGLLPRQPARPNWSADQSTNQIAPSRTSTGNAFSARAPVVALIAPASGLNAPWGPRSILPVATS